MAYDEDLAHRIRAIAGTMPGLSEKRMFGGLAFLVNGNMAVAASSKGGIMVRVPHDETEALLAGEHVGPMHMAGKHGARGWLRVSDEGVESDEALTEWTNRGLDTAAELPPK